MKNKQILATILFTIVAAVGLCDLVWAATSVQIGDSGKTFASSSVQCVADPVSGQMLPTVQAGLFNASRKAKAIVSLNGNPVANVTSASPVANLQLIDGDNTVIVALDRKTADSYTFTAQPGMCALPDTSGNTFSTDRSLEYAASGKSYATVIPGCALNPLTGQTQPFINLFDNGSYMLNVSINDTPLTQLNGTTRKSTPIFLSSGNNVISAANGTLSIDYYVRDGGNGSCTLP
jgi:hypothetical protein